MGYSRETYDNAIVKLQERKREAEQQAQERREIFFDRCPRGREIQQLLAKTAYQTARSVFQKGNSTEALKKLKEINLKLQNERTALLKENGFPVDYLTVRYTCPICKDSGYVDGKMCQCLKDLLRQTEYARLNAMTPLSLSTFDSFSLSFYQNDAKNKMQYIFNYTKQYASTFTPHSPSLLFSGGTGLGKTHLSLAIANEVLQNGFGVIYMTAQDMALKLDNERFGNDSVNTHNHAVNCDLLIIDDLGTEFSNSYVTATIYNIMNTRLLSEKPTIINTNLSMRDLEKRYSERLVSRIIGGYVCLHFAGKDIRQLKKLHEIKRDKN